MKRVFKIIVILDVAISFIIAFSLRNSYADNSIIHAEMNNFLLEKSITKIDYYCGEDDFELDETYEILKNEIKAAKESECIIEGYPTGCTYFNKDVVLQEVEVKAVIKGFCESKRVWISNNGATVEEKMNGDITLIGYDYGLMKEGNKYMIFCKPNAINNWSDKKVYEINDAMWFSYFNMDTESHELVSRNDYKRDIEFYTDSYRVLDFYNKLKKVIISEVIN